MCEENDVCIECQVKERIGTLHEMVADFAQVGEEAGPVEAALIASVAIDIVELNTILNLKDLRMAITEVLREEEEDEN